MTPDALLGGMKIEDYPKRQSSYVATYIQFQRPEYWNPEDMPGEIITVCSTNWTSIADKEGDARPYLYNDVWCGPEDVKSFPKVLYSSRCGRVHEVLPMPKDPYESIMEYLEAEGIPYVWCWTGYHVHSVEVCSLDASYCPVDVFMQSSHQRHAQGDLYDHYIATDVVAPSMVHCSNTMIFRGTRTMDGYYV